MIRNANEKTNHDSRPDPSTYRNLQYLSVELSGHSACSQTLELSYNDFGISQVASLLGEEELKNDFLKRSKFYKNVWNPKTKFFEPKYKNNTFKKISVKERTNIFSNNYVEGDAWHYRFYAPHDPSGLI